MSWVELGMGKERIGGDGIIYHRVQNYRNRCCFGKGSGRSWKDVELFAKMKDKIGMKGEHLWSVHTGNAT